MLNHHEFWWRFFPKKELTQVYVSAALRSFAISLLGIFIPLYLYIERGFSLQETLIFFLFYSVIFAISTPLAAKFSSSYGVKHSILLSVPLYLAFVALLFLLESFSIPLVILGAFLGSSQAFYWMGMHLVFHHASHRGHRGAEVGKRDGINILSAMFGPFLGGLVISFFGFTAIFILAAVILLASATVLLANGDNPTLYHFSLRSLLNREHWQDSLYFTSKGTAVIANGVIWPLFIFLILGDYLSLGLIGSIISGVSAVLLWLVGRYSDHTCKRKIIWWSTGLDSTAWFLKALVTTVPQVFGITIFWSITNGIRESPLGALEYDKAHDEVASYFVSREVFICLGRILLLSLVLFTGSLASGLYFQGFANLAALIF
ncbi:hypothetical protein COV20_03585 [Candidatus Woesearchaeota archaeon CG10_big_fil_rev_8_21_14_0_10_45_16]|nr:MAG: hypothetical protein COV20_03585 [Candidatus Woesearchaeota archaeon CG10_big_fil_rev_8_21_14_0_10_45_16]